MIKAGEETKKPKVCPQACLQPALPLISQFISPGTSVFFSPPTEMKPTPFATCLLYRNALKINIHCETRRASEE